MTEVAFLLVAAVLIPASLLVVAAPNLFHGALALALALVGTAVLYLLLAAEFLALIQVLLYAGGVVTLVVFAITVTGRLGGGPELGIARGRLAGLAVSVGLFALLADQFLRAGLPVGWAKAPAEPTRALAESLVTTYLLPFEALSALLLVAMVAAIILARRDDTEERR
jgi:NADH-quinone oxidoreductase subunit J